MVPVDRVKSGLASYIDSEILPSVSGWKKWALSAAATAYLNKADAILNKARDNEALNILGLVDENNGIDVDQIYNLLRPAAEKCNASIDIPMIGKITLSVSDVDKIYNMIR